MAERTPGHDAHAAPREELRARLAAWTSGLLNLLSVALLAILVVRFTVALSPEWRHRLNRLSAEIWAVFAVDVAVQLALTADRKRFLARNWLLALSVVLPAVRVVHVARVLLTLHELSLAHVLGAANNATRTLSRMLRGHQFGRALALTGVVTVVGAAGLVAFEGGGARGYGNALWWSAAFVATVGSDFQPRTIEGRILALLLVAWGLGVVGYVTAGIASYLVGQTTPADTTETDGSELRQLRAEVAELKAILTQIVEQRRD